MVLAANGANDDNGADRANSVNLGGKWRVAVMYTWQHRPYISSNRLIFAVQSRSD